MGIGRLLRTLVHITPVQAIYQIKNRLFTVKSLRQFRDDNQYNTSPLELLPLPVRKSAVASNQQFEFLNLVKLFPTKIDWNYSAYGKLWNYNLQYLDYINQEDISEDVRVGWIRDLYGSLDAGSLLLEPYPVSLRVMNMMRFFSRDESRIARFAELQSGLYAELVYLSKHYEYHILGNHLLENAFAMLMGSFYFNIIEWRTKASKLLVKQLDEQLLADGAHFELSPMYHQIILFRLLEALCYLGPKNDFTGYLSDKASLMLGWLNQISFSNGQIPHFNDSTDGVGFTVQQLQEFAAKLNILPTTHSLGDSGYRKFANDKFELVVDVHGISPNYQPGHSHSDHLSFVLFASKKPFIVDPGTSTYNIGERRDWERSSKAHSTVTVNDRNQSEVWSGFRVGRRAKVRIICEDRNSIAALASYIGIKHTRKFEVLQNSIKILDSVNSLSSSVARFYLHPSILVSSSTDCEVNLSNGITVTFESIFGISIEEYDYAEGFNKLKKGMVIEAFFKGKIETIIRTN